MKIAFLSNFTIDIIAKEFKKALGNTEIYISGYNQYNVDIINKESLFYKFKPAFTILILDGNTLGEPIEDDEECKKYSCPLCGKPAETWMRFAKTY